jgi:hypothetical protein
MRLMELRLHINKLTNHLMVNFSPLLFFICKKKSSLLLFYDRLLNL